MMTLYPMGQETNRGIFDHNKRYRLHSKGFGGTNTGTSHDRVIQKIVDLNTPNTLVHNFFRSDPTLILYQLQDGSEIAMHRAGNPYGPIDNQVVGIDPAWKDTQPENMTGKYVYDLSPIAQEKYWQVGLAMLLGVTQIPKPNRTVRERIKGEDRSTLHPVIMQNSVPLSLKDSRYVNESGLSPRTSKTIFIPHAHVTLIDTKWLQEADWQIPHLTKEQQVLNTFLRSNEGKRRFQQFTQLFVEKLRGEHPDRADVLLQHIQTAPEFGLPMGYSIRVKTITPENALQQSQDVAAIMRAQFQAYSEISRELLATHGEHLSQLGEQIVQQPGSRDFIFFSEEKPGDGNPTLTIRISPEFFSYAGVLESSGIELIRGREYKNPVSDRKVRMHRRRWAKKVRQLTKDDTKNEINRIPYKEGLVWVKDRGSKHRKLRRGNKHFPEMDWV